MFNSYGNSKSKWKFFTFAEQVPHFTIGIMDPNVSSNSDKTKLENYFIKKINEGNILTNYELKRYAKKRNFSLNKSTIINLRNDVLATALYQKPFQIKAFQTVTHDRLWWQPAHGISIFVSANVGRGEAVKNQAGDTIHRVFWGEPTMSLISVRTSLEDTSIFQRLLSVGLTRYSRIETWCRDEEKLQWGVHQEENGLAVLESIYLA